MTGCCAHRKHGVLQYIRCVPSVPLIAAMPVMVLAAGLATLADAAGGPTPQGSSYAEWVLPVADVLGEGGGGVGRPPAQTARGYLQVVTDSLVPGWLRRNGVLYGSKTHVTEYSQTFVVPASGRTWFDVTTVVVDPQYLLAPFITSSDFRKEPDGSKWSPPSLPECTGRMRADS